MSVAVRCVIGTVAIAASLWASGAAAAEAQGPPSAPVPRASGARGAPLPPPPPASGLYRRPVELIPRLGLGFPVCVDGSRSDDRCEGVRGGLTLAFAALWRVSPHFAWGGELGVGGFRYQPPQSANLERPRAGAAWLSALGRYYFFEEGGVDPYLQLGLGGAALGTQWDDAAGDTYEETGAGVALELGGGVDFYLSRVLRLGPFISYRRVFVDKLRRCRNGGGGECVDLPRDLDGHLNAVLVLGLGLTIMAGEEM